MKTVLCLCGRYRKTAAIRITRNEGKRKMARKPTRRDGSGGGCPVVLFFPKGALTHHLRNAQHFRRRWYPSRWSGRALCEADAGAFRSLRRTTDDMGKAPLVRAAPPFLPLRDQPAGWSWQSVLSCRNHRSRNGALLCQICHWQVWKGGTACHGSFGASQ